MVSLMYDLLFTLKMKFILSIALLISLCSLTLCQVVIPFTGTRPPVDFQVPDSHTVELANHFRPSGKVRFTLNGVNITQIREEYKDFWVIEFSDGNYMEYSFYTEPDVKKYNATKYFFKWHNEGGHGHKNEVCFDFGYNGATW